jgi:hypothetical protein
MRSFVFRTSMLVALALTTGFCGGWKWDVPLPH